MFLYIVIFILTLFSFFATKKEYNNNKYHDPSIRKYHNTFNIKPIFEQFAKKMLLQFSIRLPFSRVG